VEPLDVPILPITTNHATGDTQLPLAGNWTFTFTIRVSDIDQTTVSQIIPIR
jgi:copper transport protein